MKEYSIGIEFVFSDPRAGKLFGEQMHKLVATARDGRYHETHRILGDEVEAGCPLCSWTHRIYRLWATIAFALEPCEGCGLVLWQCGSMCEFWEDY